MTGSKASTKPGSPTIVVSDAKPVPFKPYENTKDVAGAKAVESKRLSETGSSKCSSPDQPDLRSRDNAGSAERHGAKSASPKQSASSSVRWEKYSASSLTTRVYMNFTLQL